MFLYASCIVLPVPLYIRFDVKIVNEDYNLNTDNVASLIAENLNFNLNAPAETSYITEVATNAVASFGSGAYVLNVEVSTDGTNWDDFIASASMKNKFVADATRITITDLSGSST